MIKMHDFLKVLLLGALVSMILDSTHGVYEPCGTNGYCVSVNYPVCDVIGGNCDIDEHCCVDTHGIYVKRGEGKNTSDDSEESAYGI